MKNFILTLFIITFTNAVCGQSKFDQALTEISNDLVVKLGQKNKRTLVVLYITDINKSTTIAGKYLADVISVNIVNEPGNFQVFDRENLNSISEAKKLIAEGYIDVDATKQLGKLLSVEVIVVGNYTVLSETLKLTLKALDSGTGFVVAASIKDLPIDGDAGALLGISVGNANSSFDENNANRGFNRPLNSNEQVNNPETVNKLCEVRKTGDYCFTNATNEVLSVEPPMYGDFPPMTLDPGQTQCMYDKKAMAYQYNVKNVATGRYFKNGEILIEQCKSKTFVIK